MKTRQLSSKSNIEYDDEMVRILQEEIDIEVYCDFMVSLGWTKVDISQDTAKTFLLNPRMIENWIQRNVQGKYSGKGRTWIFEHSKDAMLFTLRWS